MHIIKAVLTAIAAFIAFIGIGFLVGGFFRPAIAYRIGEVAFYIDLALFVIVFFYAKRKFRQK